MANRYPEHEKLHAIAEQSQLIGEFLDVGLAAQGLILCDRPGDDPNDDPRFWPTHKTITAILAEYFDIDMAKIDAEKDEMLADMRKANA